MGNPLIQPQQFTTLEDALDEFFKLHGNGAEVYDGATSFRSYLTDGAASDAIGTLASLLNMCDSVVTLFGPSDFCVGKTIKQWMGYPTRTNALATLPSE